MVIGLGRVGWSYSKEKGRGFGSSHFGAYYTHRDIDSVVAVDANAKRLSECARWFQRTNQRRRMGKEVVFVQDYVEALRKYRPDVVSVCVPTPLHNEVMKNLCYEDGPRVICLEKPIAPSLVEAMQIAKRVANACEQFGKPCVAVNFTLRWDRNWRTMKHWLPRIEPVVAHGKHPGPLLRTGIHMLDMFNNFFGDPVRVIGESDASYPSWMTRKMPETDDYSGWGVVEYANGTRAYLVGGELAKEDPYVLFEMEILGKKGAILARRNGADISLELAKQSKRYKGLRELEPDTSKHIVAATNNPRVTMVDDLVRCVRDSRRRPACDLQDAIKAETLVHLIRQSHLKWIKPEEVDTTESIRSH